MKNKQAKRIVILHTVLLTWAVLFAVSLFLLHDGGTTASFLAIGNVVFLLFNIPFSVTSIILSIRKRFAKLYTIPIMTMSILNTAMGINAWAFLILLLEEGS